MTFSISHFHILFILDFSSELILQFFIISFPTYSLTSFPSAPISPFPSTGVSSFSNFHLPSPPYWKPLFITCHSIIFCLRRGNTPHANVQSKPSARGAVGIFFSRRLKSRFAFFRSSSLNGNEQAGHGARKRIRQRAAAASRKSASQSLCALSLSSTSISSFPRVCCLWRSSTCVLHRKGMNHWLYCSSQRSHLPHVKASFLYASKVYCISDTVVSNIFQNHTILLLDFCDSWRVFDRRFFKF